MMSKISHVLNRQRPCKKTLTIITSDAQNNVLEITEHKKGNTKRLYKHGEK